MEQRESTVDRLPKSARERILVTAAADFPRRGIHATGVDTIIEHAHVTKATFYRHFRTKDALIGEYLARVGATWLEDLKTAVLRSSDDPKQRLLSIFDQLEVLFLEPGYRGCPFIAAMCEFSEPSHPCYALARRHYAAIEEYVGCLTRAAVCDKADQVARQIVILITGAMITAFREQAGGAASVLKPIVEHLLA